MRLKITLSYNGAKFSGSQIQKHTSNTVNGVLKKVFESLGFTQTLQASGRTDSGVHASAQVIHIDAPQHWEDTDKLQELLNHKLPSSIHIKEIKTVDENFHARYSANKRVYRYIISTTMSSPFEDDFITFLKSFDLKKVQRAIKLFEGEHDFEYFKKNGSASTNYVRVIYNAFAYQHKGKIILHFEANGFLYAQIRLMVGFLLQISEGKLSEEDLRSQLSKNEHFKYLPAPHNGLYLAKIKY